mmetsp:Transcript_18015/g.28191  ORF Transcript_18015/g.28191 Transcript_18015/m.28191 type:complete len:204 (-) Transcript_18015:234-845(-)
MKVTQPIISPSSINRNSVLGNPTVCRLCICSGGLANESSHSNLRSTILVSERIEMSSMIAIHFEVLYSLPGTNNTRRCAHIRNFKKQRVEVNSTYKMVILVCRFVKTCFLSQCQGDRIVCLFNKQSNIVCRRIVCVHISIDASHSGGGGVGGVRSNRERVIVCNIYGSTHSIGNHVFFICHYYNLCQRRPRGILKSRRNRIGN